MPFRRRVELTPRNVDESWTEQAAATRGIVSSSIRSAPNDLVVEDADAAALDGSHRQFLLAG